MISPQYKEGEDLPYRYYVNQAVEGDDSVRMIVRVTLDDNGVATYEEIGTYNVEEFDDNDYRR